MQSEAHTSPLLNHAVRTRAKNVDLRKKIGQLQTDIQSIENDISTLNMTYDDLVEQCQILREKQTDKTKDLLLEESEKQFQNYIHDIENYLNNKQWIAPSIEKPAIPSPKISPTLESEKKIVDIPIQTLHDDLNQQLASVENWLMESAITDNMKPTPIITDNPTKDDGTDDLYKDLMLPMLSEEMPFDENNPQEDFIKTILPENPKLQRSDKNQRRFALMRQLAEKSNKTVTRKLV